MIEQEKAKVLRLDGQAGPAEKLPYRVELWGGASGETPEHVLGQALTAAFGRAIFKAALTEYPERRITLRRGVRVIADSRAVEKPPLE